ncbi:hypothetical protein Brsp02_04346 [Brucella sp. NBRC 113783]
MKRGLELVSVRYGLAQVMNLEDFDAELSRAR